MVLPHCETGDTGTGGAPKLERSRVHRVVWVKRVIWVLATGVVVMGIAVGWIAWQFRPDIQAFPARVRASVAAHHTRWVTASAVSPSFRRALIATEDRSFATNWGISFKGLGRALAINSLHGRIEQGGSTLTQQLVSNELFGPTPSPAQKAMGIVLACFVTATYSKAEILTLYMNEVYLGQGSYGVEMAAHRYFGVSAAQLTLPEAAMLAGLPQAPSAYDPLVDWSAAKHRQRTVLDNLVAVRAISAQAAHTAYAMPLPLHQGP